MSAGHGEHMPSRCSNAPRSGANWPSAQQEFIVDALGALVFWRLIALGAPVTYTYLDRVAAAICGMARGNNLV